MKKYLILTALGIFVVLLSGILPIAQEPVRYGQWLGLQFILFLAVSFVLWDFDKFLAIFTGYCLFSTFFIAQLNSRAMILLIFLTVCIAVLGTISPGKVRMFIVAEWQ